MKVGVVLLFLLLCLRAHAQDFFAAPMQGMGNSGLALPSIYSLTVNPAGVSRIKRPQVGMAYQPHALATSIQSQALYLTLPFAQTNVVALAVNNHGLKGVSSLLTARGIYARSFGEYFSASVSTNYHQYHVKGYGGDQTVSLDLGFHFVLNELLSFGALLRNISSSHFDDTIEQYVSEEAAFGMVYHFSKEVLLAADLYYNALWGMDTRVGIAYTIDDLLVLRVGTASKPIQYFAGIGIALGRLMLDISSSFHARIGYSPQVSLSYDF